MGNNQSVPPTKTQLAQFIADGITQKEAADTLGISLPFLKGWERTYGLSRSGGQLKIPPRESIDTLVVKGWPARRIAEEFGVSPSTAQRWIEFYRGDWKRAWQKPRPVKARAVINAEVEFLANDHPLVRFMARPFELVMNDLVKFG